MTVAFLHLRQQEKVIFNQTQATSSYKNETWSALADWLRHQSIFGFFAALITYSSFVGQV